MAEIKMKHEKDLEKAQSLNKNKPLHEVLGQVLDMGNITLPCQICNL